MIKRVFFTLVLALGAVLFTQAQNADIQNVANTWKSTTFKVNAHTRTPDIKQLVMPFLRHYKKFTGNRLMLKYLTNPKGYSADHSNYGIDDQTRNGYIHCTDGVQMGASTTCCYWKRDNGHRLLAIYLEDTFENHDPEQAILFYDFDPETRTLKPDLNMAEIMNAAINRVKSSEIYVIDLPSKGKNIEMRVFPKNKNEEGCMTHTLRWNGISFDIDEKVVPCY